VRLCHLVAAFLVGLVLAFVLARSGVLPPGLLPWVTP
jgi:hypothetical protein